MVVGVTKIIQKIPRKAYNIITSILLYLPEEQLAPEKPGGQ